MIKKLRDKEPEMQAWFDENFAKRGEVGASVSIWYEGEEIIGLHAGKLSPTDKRDWNLNTIVPVWSATKPIAAATVLNALDAVGLGPDDPVSELWPELTAAKGTGLTFGHILSHQSGLAALDPKNRPNITNYKAVITALENQKPKWAPGSGHGYHARTYGFLLDEIMRRMTNLPLGMYWREKIADPNGIDFWIGLPEESESVRARLAKLVAPKKTRKPADEKDFYKAYGKKTSLTRQAFDSPAGADSFTDMNTLKYLKLGLPAMGGIGSGSGLAKFYAILANGGKWWSRRVFSKNVIAHMQKVLTEGKDQVLLTETAYSAGAMLDPVKRGKKTRQLFGPNLTSFGQPGAGGCHAFGDPENRLAFGYVMNQMEPGIFPNEKCMEIVKILYS
ncbi:MAG: beta-lactamase family protein [Verrucomicrobiales bacterium]|nr:beta-lactamase family protein [Verrucomicrobiales bacterium]